MSKPVMLSGTQPTGSLHLGNYLGALKNWLEIQNSGKYDCYFFLADYHSISEDYDPKEKADQIFDLACTYLALGFDPKKSTIFVQSHVPICTELAWIFNTVTPVAEMQRMTQFKDKSAKQVKNINMGLFSYPVLQAADILLYKGAFVPVGEDQVQHVELTRDIARWFNKKYGVEYFPESKPILTPAARVMSLVDEDSKMSKSAGDKHWIGISEEPEAIEKKLSKAVTTPKGIENLRALYDALTENMHGDFNPDRMGDTKKVIAAGIAEHFKDFREKKAKLLKDKKYVMQVLEEGRQKAQKVAEKNIEEIKKIVGVK